MTPPRSTFAIAVMSLAVMALAASVPLAPPAAAATELDVDAGYGGSFRMGSPVPVRVRISADRLLRGELAVLTTDSYGDSVTVAVPVEVPGGSDKEVVVVVPLDQGGDRRGLRAELREFGVVVAEGTATVATAPDQELVGLLPGVLDGRQPPGPVPLAIDVGTARFSALGSAELSVAPASLAALDVIGASATDLAALDPGAREAVLGWVAQGGHLLVDAEPRTEVEGLPPAWQPGPSGRTAAGLGEVRATAGAMAGGTWAGLIEPTSAGVSPGTGFFGPFNLDSTLARDAGLSVPRLGWLVAFLLVYVGLAVPLTLTILRRRGRGELGWVILPVVALVFTGASYGVGREVRDTTTVAHATILHTSAAGISAATSVAVVSPNGGVVEVGYPRRWAPMGRSHMSSAPPGASTATLGPSGTSVAQRLDVGQFGVQRASGPVTLDGGLVVGAVAGADGVLRGTVRNDTGFPLEEVAVFHDRTGVEVGRLEPGEELGFDLDLATLPGDPFAGPAVRMWPEASGFDRMPDPDSVVAFPLWNEFEASSASDPLRPGTMVAAGWTRDYRPPVDVPGSSVTGRTLVVGTAPVDPGDGNVAPATVRTDVVRGPYLGGAFDERAPVVVRLALPPSSEAFDPTTLELRAPQGFELDVWSGGAWQRLDGDPVPVSDAPVPGPSGFPGPPPPPPGHGPVAEVCGPAGCFAAEPGSDPFGPRRGHALPPGAIDGGVIWARATAGGAGFVDPSLMTTIGIISLAPAP